MITGIFLNGNDEKDVFKKLDSCGRVTSLFSQVSTLMDVASDSWTLSVTKFALMFCSLGNFIVTTIMLTEGTMKPNQPNP